MTAILLAVISLQQTQIPSHQLSGRISGQGLERRIGIDNRMIGALSIDQHHPFRGALNQAPV